MAKTVGKSKTKPTAELVPAEAETDLAFAQAAGSAVVSFLKKATEFFKRAEDLEVKSRAVFDVAKALKLPKNGDEDATLQKLIQRCSVGKKTVEAHWDGSDAEPGITKILHRLHRRTAARRDVSIKLLDEAAAIGNALHNEYTTAEKRRAEQETRRLQAIEDEKARARRAEELAELERQAEEREAASEELSEREQAFVLRVAVNYDPTVAAREAGFKNPESKGKQLLTYTKIANAIEARREANALRNQAAAVAQAPIEVRQVEVQPDIVNAPGAHDVTRWKAKITDPDAFIAAVFEGKAGIPRDVLCIDVVRLNQYARDLRKVIDRWPGVEAVSDTKVQ